jgi:transposase
MKKVIPGGKGGAAAAKAAAATAISPDGRKNAASRTSSRKKEADLSPPVKTGSGPAHSEVQKMGTQKERPAMRSVALDLAVRKIAYCEVQKGQVLIRRTVSSLESLRDLLGPACLPSRVAIEACREAWHVHAELTRWGNEVILVDTTRVRRIGVGEHGRKTDRIDAEKLALALEKGGLPKAHLLSPARQRLRFELGIRRALVETRAEYVTTIRGIARAHGVRLPSCGTDNFVSRLRRTPLDPTQRELIEPLSSIVEKVDLQLAQTERHLQAIVESDAQIRLLMTMPSVNVIVAAVFVSVIDEARRFKDAHQVGAYLGLVPLEKSTGERRRLGAITKQGNSYARAMLMQTSWGILRRRSEDPLHCWAQAVAQRRGKCIAAVALARRVAGVLWAMWRDDAAYDPARVGLRSATGLARHAEEIEFRAAAMKRAATKAHRRASVHERKLKEMSH